MLKMIDLGIGAGPVFLGGQLFHPFHKDTAVPGAVIDGDETGAGDVPPETPQIMMRQLFIRRRTDGNDTRDAGICAGRETPDGSPLAGGIPAFKYECGRDAFFVRPERKLIDLLLQAFQFLLVMLGSLHTGKVDGIQGGDQGLSGVLFHFGHGFQHLEAGGTGIVGGDGPLDACDNGFHHGQVTEIGIRGVDDAPGRIVPVCQHDGPGRGADHAVVIRSSCRMAKNAPGPGSPDAP